MKLDLVQGLSWWMLGAFLVGSCIIKILSVSLAGRFAGFRGLDLINLAITTNARGGPGIVLASVAFDAGIISPKFYTTLVLAAVLTSQVSRGLAGLRSEKGLAPPKALTDNHFVRGRRGSATISCLAGYSSSQRLLNSRWGFRIGISSYQRYLRRMLRLDTRNPRCYYPGTREPFVDDC